MFGVKNTKVHVHMAFNSTEVITTFPFPATEGCRLSVQGKRCKDVAVLRVDSRSMRHDVIHSWSWVTYRSATAWTDVNIQWYNKPITMMNKVTWFMQFITCFSSHQLFDGGIFDPAFSDKQTHETTSIDKYEISTSKFFFL